MRRGLLLLSCLAALAGDAGAQAPRNRFWLENHSGEPILRVLLAPADDLAQREEVLAEPLPPRGRRWIVPRSPACHLALRVEPESGPAIALMTFDACRLARIEVPPLSAAPPPSAAPADPAQPRRGPRLTLPEPWSISPPEPWDIIPPNRGPRR
ncbi:hypothetical protein [Falsiroseomonas sp. CW058]|uniref:hypothetical protein n=1 Tax=Falsiroseomonas sp. CW058 TaxID=3388664 RepID=UPI003D31C1B8